MSEHAKATLAVLFGLLIAACVNNAPAPEPAGETGPSPGEARTETVEAAAEDAAQSEPAEDEPASTSSAASAESSAVTSSGPSSPSSVPASGDMILDLPPGEQASEDVQGFLGQYYAAIKSAQLKAKQSRRPVRIQIDRAKARIVLLDGDKELKSLRYPESVTVLREPDKVTVMPNFAIDFTGRDYNHPHPTKSTSHVLAHVKGFPDHAFVRFKKWTSDLTVMVAKYEERVIKFDPPKQPGSSSAAAPSSKPAPPKQGE